MQLTPIDGMGNKGSRDGKSKGREKKPDPTQGESEHAMEIEKPALGSEEKKKKFHTFESNGT
eukprot:541798-Amorphochlora_amoeboformis.AAC.1